MHVTKSIFFVPIFCERRILLKYKVQKSLYHFYLSAPFSDSLGFLNESHPHLKVLSKAHPMLCHFSAHHFSELLQEASHKSFLFSACFSWSSFWWSNDVRYDTLKQIFHTDSGASLDRKYIALPILPKWLQKLPTMPSYNLFKPLCCPLW